MRTRFTQLFKIQAVEKALERANGVTVKNIANDPHWVVVVLLLTIIQPELFTVYCFLCVDSGIYMGLTCSALVN